MTAVDYQKRTALATAISIIGIFAAIAFFLLALCILLIDAF